MRLLFHLISRCICSHINKEITRNHMARPTIQFNNEDVQTYLTAYLTLNHFMNDSGVPRVITAAVDDILEGVSRLDYGGNTRPLSKSKLYTLLSALPIVSTATVQAATGQSSRHSRNLSQALRVASTAILNTLVKHGEPCSL